MTVIWTSLVQSVMPTKLLGEKIPMARGHPGLSMSLTWSSMMPIPSILGILTVTVIWTFLVPADLTSPGGKILMVQVNHEPSILLMGTSILLGQSTRKTSTVMAMVTWTSSVQPVSPSPGGMLVDITLLIHSNQAF